MREKNTFYQVTEKESERISILKLLCCVLVVYIHTMTESNVMPDIMQTFTLESLLQVIQFVWIHFVCECANPIFFIISGVMLYRKPFTWKENIKKKIYTILVPFLLINTFWILFYLMAQNIPFTRNYFDTKDLKVSSWGIFEWIEAYIGGIIKNTERLWGPAMGWLWFLRDLFILNLAAPLIKRIVDKFPKSYFCIICLGWFVAGGMNAFWYRGALALLFFSIGCYFVKYKIYLSDVLHMRGGFFIFIWIVSVLLGCLTHETNNWIYEMAHIICILTAGCLVSQFAFYLQKGAMKNKLVKLAGYTMPIYLLHERSLTILLKIMKRFIQPGGGMNFVYVA